MIFFPIASHVQTHYNIKSQSEISVLIIPSHTVSHVKVIKYTKLLYSNTGKSNNNISLTNYTINYNSGHLYQKQLTMESNGAKLTCIEFHLCCSCIKQIVHFINTFSCSINIVSWEAKEFNYQSFAHWVRSFCLSVNDILIIH